VDLFVKLAQSIKRNQSRPAFCFDGIFFTYKDLAVTISEVRQHISLHVPKTEKIIGLIANDDLKTYASIIALWFEGRAYMPLTPGSPEERNNFMIKEAGIKTILDSSAIFSSPLITSDEKLSSPRIDLKPLPSGENELAYLLFTSGTTGVPKGVPITKANITSFAKNFNLVIDTINEKDKWLQMFDLGFDLSIMSFLVPLLKGACIYTIPPRKIKYNYIFNLINEEHITGALLVPSVLHYLRPYFSEIHSAEMKLCLFCGEALLKEIAEEWQLCIPNAKILNLYGPTENTIFCTHYSLSKNNPASNKSYNGILSIGKQMQNTFAIVVDGNNRIVPAGKKGELCLGGTQLTPGYWDNDKKNTEAFFYTDYAGKQERFYKTGDFCMTDDDGDIMFIGRMDNQVKIQGFRVEFTEIEFYAKEFLKNINVVATTFTNIVGNNEIALIIESETINTHALLEHLKKKLPAYMIPSRINFCPELPYNKNGKVDRNSLKDLFATR